MLRRRVRLKKRLPNYVLAKEIVIVVVESRDIDIDCFAENAAIAELIAIELFRREVWVGVETREIGRSIRCRRDVAGEIEVFLDIGRRSHSVRKSRPHGLLVSGRPQEL